MNQSDSIELKFDFPEMQKWNILTNRANSRWKKRGDYLFIYNITFRNMAIKMSKLAHFWHFNGHISHSFGNMFKCISKVIFFQKML